MKDFIILENQLEADAFIRLFDSAGWGLLPKDIVEVSLKNSYVTFCVKDGEQVIAMARLLGDGGLAFFLKDLVVDPSYQGQGIGRRMMEHIENYIQSQLHDGWKSYFQLASAKGKEEFYRKLGYREHPNEHSGPAFSKWI